MMHLLHVQTVPLLYKEAELNSQPNVKKKLEPRWLALCIITLVAFIVMFVLSIGFGSCGGTLTTINYPQEQSACANGSSANCTMSNGSSCGMGHMNHSNGASAVNNASDCNSCSMTAEQLMAQMNKGNCDLNKAVTSGKATLGSTPMKCHWAYLAAAFMALIGVLAGLGMLRLPGVHGRRFAGILAIVAAVFALAFPTILIGTCGMQMHCGKMLWPVLACAVVGVVCGILAWPWCKAKTPKKPKLEL